MRIYTFLAYNNAVPIVLGILFISSGLVFAANDEVRGFVADSVYKAQRTVISVDNSYIATKDLQTYSPTVSIKNVTEDDENYYIDYSFTTIALKDYVWQDVVQQKTMQVAKDALGGYTDLGVYVTEQLKQLVEREIAYLQEVQRIERRNVTRKVVATAYSGLVGQFIDDSTETLPGYTPRVTEPAAEEAPDPVAVAKANQEHVAPPAPPPSNSADAGGTGGTTPQQTQNGPVITILGANPARIAVGSTYSDLGVVTTTQAGATLDLSVTLTLNGNEVNYIDIDTSAPADWSVGYSVTDADGNTSFAERVVIVYDPNAQTQGDTASTDAATTTATTTAATTTATTTPPTTTGATSTPTEPAPAATESPPASTAPTSTTTSQESTPQSEAPADTPPVTATTTSPQSESDTATGDTTTTTATTTDTATPPPPEAAPTPTTEASTTEATTTPAQ